MLKTFFTQTFLLIFLCVYLLILFNHINEKESSAGSDADAKKEFILNSQDGKVSLSDFKNKVVLIYFGYTWCPDICPTNLSILASAFQQLDESELQQVQGIFISVDPQRDSVERLHEYSQYFHPSIIGLTADENTIKKVSSDYGAAYRINKQDSATNYVVDHTSYTYLINPEGEHIKTFPHASSAEILLAAIRENLPD